MVSPKTKYYLMNMTRDIVVSATSNMSSGDLCGSRGENVGDFFTEIYNKLLSIAEEIEKV